MFYRVGGGHTAVDVLASSSEVTDILAFGVSPGQVAALLTHGPGVAVIGEERRRPVAVGPAVGGGPQGPGREPV